MVVVCSVPEHPSSRTFDGADARRPVTAGQLLRRRRRITAVLASATLVTLIVALTVALPGVWALAVVSDLVFAGYLGRLIHARNVSAGIEMSAQSLGA